jgi:L-threonylcarbamoyladenylate synthase
MAAIIGKDIEHAAQFLISGEVVAIPTETVYGLAANALDVSAVQRIFSVKKRPDFDPLIVHIKGVDSLEDYAKHIPVKAKLLAEKFWPGPITLVLPKKENIPFNVTSGLDTVALRVPRHPMTIELLSKLDFPLAAPSANPFGYISPTTPLHVFQQLGNDIPYILDGGTCEVGIESTIVGFENNYPVIYRPGIITKSMIEEIVGEVLISSKISSHPKAPGMLLSHYAPKTTMKLIKNKDEVFMKKNAGYLAFQHFHPLFPVANQRILSESGNIFEAARNLYAAMRELDQLHLDIIYTEEIYGIVGAEGINDRIRRATA